MAEAGCRFEVQGLRKQPPLLAQSAALLVLDLYSPKPYRLNFLRVPAGQIAPASSRHARSRRCFELLRRAYETARYSLHNEITAKEL